MIARQGERRREDTPEDAYPALNASFEVYGSDDENGSTSWATDWQRLTLSDSPEAPSGVASNAPPVAPPPAARKSLFASVFCTSSARRTNHSPPCEPEAGSDSSDERLTGSGLEMGIEGLELLEAELLDAVHLGTDLQSDRFQ